MTHGRAGRAAILAALLGLFAQSALAQDGSDPIATAPPALPDPTANTVTVGLGAGIAPDYEGSKDYHVIPGGALLGRYEGREFFMRGLQLYVDLIPDQPDQKVNLAAGPVVGLRLNRTSDVDNAQVEALGELDAAIEGGAYAAIGVSKLLSDYDSLTFRGTYLRDFAGAHESFIFTPAIEYGTPLNRRTYVRVYASADFVGDGYASYYFDVTPAGSAASGLAPFAADGGFKSWSAGVIAAYSIKGLGKGPSIFAIGAYSRLRGDFARSPIVSDVGDANQLFGAMGLAYTF